MQLRDALARTDAGVVLPGIDRVDQDGYGTQFSERTLNDVKCPIERRAGRCAHAVQFVYPAVAGGEQRVGVVEFCLESGDEGLVVDAPCFRCGGGRGGFLRLVGRTTSARLCEWLAVCVASIEHRALGRVAASLGRV